MKEVRAQTFRQMKHDNTVRFPAAEGKKKNKLICDAAEILRNV